MRFRTAAATLAVIAAAACGTARPASAQAALSAPGVAVFTGLPLRDATVMQSFAYDGTHKVWVFAQLTAGAPASSGDLTLTKVSAAGARLGWMHLRGFGHGLSIGAEPCGGTTCAWTEASALPGPAPGGPPGAGYGHRIARFAWQQGVTLTPASRGVEVFTPNGGAPHQTPSVDAAAGLIAVRYWSAALRAYRWAVYSLAAFRRHSYPALARVTMPAVLRAGTEQGWVLASRTVIANWQGEAGGPATFAVISTAGAVTGPVVSTAGSGLSFREPEGAARISAGNLCTGFASGPAGARRANIYCDARP